MPKSYAFFLANEDFLCYLKTIYIGFAQQIIKTRIKRSNMALLLELSIIKAIWVDCLSIDWVL